MCENLRVTDYVKFEFIFYGHIGKNTIGNFGVISKDHN